MRGPMLKILACLLAVCFVTTAVAEAAQRTGTKKNRRSRPDAEKAYSLEDIMKEPKTYLEREVFFYCRYATTANLFKNINTRFNVNEHVNFAVWPDKTILWEEKSRKNLLPTLYIPKIEPEVLEMLRGINKYELIAVTGEVLNVYAGYPWILVTSIERVEIPSDRICDTTIQHMQAGYEALKAESGGTAARQFEQALQAGMPAEFRSKAYEQLAQAYLLDNRLDKAREYLRQSIEADRSDSILHLALADVALKMGDAGEALAHCEFALELSGRHPQVYGIMGEAKSLMGDFVKAFNDLNIAAGSPGITTREKAMVNVRRARIYVRAGRFPDAARVYVAASEPGEPLAGEAWLHNEIGLFYERQYLESGDERYLDSAYSAYEEASKLNRLDASILYNMVETEFRRQRLQIMPDFTLAKELIGRINQIEPDYTPARILEGRVLFAEEKLEEAEYRYQSVVNQISDDPISLMALAEAYIDLGRYLDAAKTVRRARSMQPWNTRVQALGKFLEETAEAIARAEAETRFDGWLNVPQQQQGMPQMLPEPRVETLDARYGRPVIPQGRRYAEARPQRPAPSQDPRIAKGLARRPSADRYEDPADMHRGAPQRRVAEVRPRNPQDIYRPDAHRAEGTQVRVRPGEGIRAGSNNGVAYAEPREYRDYPQDIQASARPAPTPGNGERGYPVTEVRLNNQNQTRQESRRGEPEPLNLGYTPGRIEAPTGVEPTHGEPRYEQPARIRSEVRNDEPGSAERGYDGRYDEPQYRQEQRHGGAREPQRRENRQDAEYYDERPEPGRNESQRSEPPRFGEQRYDSGKHSAEPYVSRSEPPRYEEERYERQPRREQPRYQDDRRAYPPEPQRYDSPRDPRTGYERDMYREERQPRYETEHRDYRDEYRGRHDDRRQPERPNEYYDEDGYLRYGLLPGTIEAYASMPVAFIENECEEDEGGVRIPEAFSFAPDASPVIIASVTAPAVGGLDMPVRNANVFRPMVGGRQPAEIIEKEPVNPRANPDTSVMAPPGSGDIHRTEVNLPSSSRGVGMASDYHPGS